MIICVPVKRVIDYRVNVQVNSDASGVTTAGVKFSMNPFDEIALEQALQLREQGIATDVVAITLGDSLSDDTLRTALAMGADRAVRVDVNEVPTPFIAASLLSAWVKQAKCDCVIMGKQAIDDDCNQTGQLLAGFLDWPQATFASSITFSEDRSSVEVTREIDGGLDTLRCQMPAVITVDLRLCEPRLPNLPSIMKAKSKSIELIKPDALGVELNNTLQVSNYRKPLPRQGGEKVESFDALMAALKEAGVLS